VNILFKCFPIALTFFVLSSQLFAQSQHFRSYGIDEGLSQSYVYNLLQDEKGYIWVGTGDGLSKFNSRKFTNFTTQDSLNEDFVTAMCIDAQGNNLIGHFGGGLSYYNKNTQSFEKKQLNDPISLIENTSRVNKLLKTRDNQIWCLTQNNGLFHIDKSQKITHFKKGLEGILLYDLLVSSEGKLFVATNVGVLILEIQGDDFKIKTIQGLEGNTVTCMAFSKVKKGFWLASQEGGLFFYSTDNQILNPIEFQENTQGENTLSIQEILEGTQNNLWLGTSEDGLFKLSFEATNPQKIITVRQFRENEGLDNPFVSALLQDKEGNIWVGTYGSGLFQFRGELFSAYHIVKFLPSPHVSAVLKDRQGNFWIGTELGVVKITGETITKAQPKTTIFLKNTDISSLFEDKMGKIWVGTNGNGAFRLNPKNEKIEHLNKRDGFEAQIINKITADADDNVWLASSRVGALQYSIEEDSFAQYSLREGFLSNNINDIFVDSKDRIWFASLGAPLSYFENGELVVLNSEIINGINFLCITEDHKGIIWIGTEGAGIFSYDGEEFEVFNTSQGLLSNYAYSIKTDTNNNIWIGSRKGISKYLRGEKLFKHFDSQSGFSNLRIATHGIFEEQNGDLWFSTFEGVMHYQASHENKNTVEPPVYFTKITADLDAVNLEEALELPYGKHIFQFEFEALSFSEAQKVRYQYKLEGYESEWSILTQNSFAHYSHVEDGEYTFLVKAANNDGLWSTAKEFAVSVEAPIWKKWWFYVLIALILTVSILAYIRFRLYRLEKEKKKLEDLVEKQTHVIRKEKENIEEKNKVLKTTLDKLQTTQGQLIQAEKMASLGQLTAGLAHEMNNPLNFVQAGIRALEANIDDTLELIEQYTKAEQAEGEEREEILKEINELKEEIEFEELPDDTRGLLSDIYTGAERTTQIVASLRDFSRLDEASLKAVNIHEGLNATILLLSSQINDEVTVTKNYDKNLPEIECYVSQLNQVFLHLLTNAIQSIEGEGEIIISTRNTDKTVEISFKDTGSGIKKEVLDKIFDPFFTTKDVGEGKGLGLSTSYGIIQNHDGHIEVKSEEGKGSEFIISIPKKIEEV
jgi:signal transduction histidine kinase/sugar lactone lactonase YvrE